MAAEIMPICWKETAGQHQLSAILLIRKAFSLWKCHCSQNRWSSSSPVVLKYDNGEGLTFKRTIAIDERYLFTVKDEVSNIGSTPVTLYPFALISRHGAPEVSGYYILHEGLIGYLGEKGLQEYPYKSIDDAKQVEFNVTNGWLGITDKYWASALLPDNTAKLKARFSSREYTAIPGSRVGCDFS